MISILIPTYNTNIYSLVEELQLQCNAVGVVFEIICLDDGSSNFITENKAITKFENCFYYYSADNKGRTITRDSLAKKAKFKNLLFLDADVLPKGKKFIHNYLIKINKASVIIGGYCYDEQYKTDKNIFRYTYGKKREEIAAIERNKNPYKYYFSGNLLIDKTVFLENNSSENTNLYGLDNIISYNLFINNVSLFHIDNPIIHLGLENNEIFFKKCLDSVETRYSILLKKDNAEKINNLILYYKKLKKYKLTSLTNTLFNVFEPYLKKRILSKNPNLFFLDLYRLGYICSID